MTLRDQELCVTEILLRRFGFQWVYRNLEFSEFIASLIEVHV